MLSLLIDRSDLILTSIDALIAFIVTVAAVTPTDKDDGVVSRIANLWARAKAPLTFLLPRR